MVPKVVSREGRQRITDRRFLHIQGRPSRTFKEVLFAAARRPFLGTAVGKAFQYCSWALPVQKVYEERDVLAFRHPRPSYENHLILSPKRAVRNLQQMAQEDGGSDFAQIWRAVETVRARHQEYQSGFTLVANGGKRQDVQQVHFHMFTGDAVVNAYPAREPGEHAVFQDGAVIVLQHPRPNWETHYVILPGALETGSGEAAERYFGAVLQSIDRLDEVFGLVQRGYSLVCHCKAGSAEAGLPVFHIVAGRRMG